MAGRYHANASATLEKMKTQQAVRTAERRTCTFHSSRRGCQFALRCTRRHDRNEQEKRDGKYARLARECEAAEPTQNPSHMILNRAQTRTTVESTEETILIRNLDRNRASSFGASSSTFAAASSEARGAVRQRSESPQTDRRRARGGTRTGDDNVWEFLRAKNSAVPPIGRCPKNYFGPPPVPKLGARAQSLVPIGGRAPLSKAAEKKAPPPPKDSIGRKKQRYGCSS